MRGANIIDLAELSGEARAALMKRAEHDVSAILEPVRAIADRVAGGGDRAVAELGREIDGAPLSPDRLFATEQEFEDAEALVEPEVKAAIEEAARNIRLFHEKQMPPPMWLEEIREGAFAGERHRPIPSCGCYVPRGKGSFPSVVMMTTIPAVVAGVPEIVILTPPTPEGGVDAASLVAARRVGVSRVYKAGGAVAVAAAAHGTYSLPKLAKIVGPGSPWLVAAKKLLADRMDTGLPAGPSEAIILADEHANPEIAALDLLIEAEHGPDSSAYLVTPSRRVAEAAARVLPDLWARMGEQRVGFSSTVLSGPRGGILVARDMDDAVAFVNEYAPEHLEILAAEPMGLMNRIEHAGEILLGENTPIVIANFVLGPDAVLPTGGNARTWSPLSVFDFLKRTGIGYATRAGYERLAEPARRLARYEGFDAHANAIELRERYRR
ncbi:histidinol dehydrogenase [Geminicoccus roseus]|uniref:histidinol dehydrogenase n=1 Tax=Geminicoccus roseus TaxID=404900 RepID=UPI00041FF191|nr:histidinol dehydrogenase [Geminicoccus roseus]